MQQQTGESVGQGLGRRANVPERPIRPALHAPGARSSWRTIWRRMARVLRFDSSVYAEIANDPASTGEAARVVAFVAAAAGLATGIATSWQAGAILGAVLAALVHWLLWSGLVHLIGTWLFRRQGTLEHLVRGLGYAQTPQLLALFGFLPIVGPLLVVASRVMTMVAGQHAVSESFGLSRRQTIPIVLVSSGITLAAGALVHAWLGDVGPLTAILRP